MFDLRFFFVSEYLDINIALMSDKWWKTLSITNIWIIKPEIPISISSIVGESILLFK